MKGKWRRERVRARLRALAAAYIPECVLVRDAGHRIESLPCWCHRAACVRAGRMPGCMGRVRAKGSGRGLRSECSDVLFPATPRNAAQRPRCYQPQLPFRASKCPSTVNGRASRVPGAGRHAQQPAAAGGTKMTLGIALGPSAVRVRPLSPRTSLLTVVLHS